MNRMLDVEDFPVGTRVQTPSGRVGTVIKHRGSQSKFDHFERLIVLYDGCNHKDIVALQPQYLTKVQYEESTT